MVKLNKRKGNLGIILLALIIVFTLVVVSFITIEEKTVTIKRQNIHNAVVAANLASYYAIENGNKDKVLSYSPEQLQGFITNPDTIIEQGIPLNNVVNTMTSEYFPKGERYKSIFLNQNEAYTYFSNYLKENLNLKQGTNNYSFVPKDDESNKGGIKELKVKSFEVYNAVYKNMKKATIPTEVKKENRTYTGIHLDLDATVYHNVKYGPIKDTSNVPIHIDTEISLYRPTIK